MKLKKFNQFVNKINEDLNENEFDSIDDLRMANQEEDISNDIEDEDEYDLVAQNQPMDNMDEEEDNDDENYYEEEGDEYEGTKKMRELSKILNTPITNNQINYNGHKINFYSETEKFHVDGQKLDDINSVLKLVQFEDSNEPIETDIESDNISDTIEEGRKWIRKF